MVKKPHQAAEKGALRMISIDAFLSTLPVMLYGMGGIFLVMIVIYCVIGILNKLFPEKHHGQE